MKTVKKITAMTMAVIMCAGAAGCSSSDTANGEYDAGTYLETAADNYGGDSYDAEPVYTTTAGGNYAGNHIMPPGNSGVLQHADGSISNGGMVGVEANADDTYLIDADESYLTAATTSAGIWKEGYWYTYNAEEYGKIIENGYKSTAQNPLSTFSIDVDTASYSNIRRMIEYGWGIEPDAVRIEEFINYFDYDYPEPKTDDPFSVTTELSDCPWNDDAKLLLVGLKAEDIDMNEREPLNLVFLIDVSGSMFSEDKLPLVQKSFSMLTENLGEDDRISIVTYAGEDKTVLGGTSGADKEKIKEAINGLEAGGSTYGEAGINRAYELAEKYFIKNGNNRVILATDGDLNVGLSSTEELTKLIEEKRESGVYLSVLGFGSGNIKDDRMEALADCGNGNYSYIDSELEAKKVLVEEMCGTLYTVAKDVKIQVEFNPANVASYRLIGYENRALANKDFSDDTKDAGEIGAGHTVTALYELILEGTASNIDLKYQQDKPAVTERNEYSDELLTVSLRYKYPDSDTSKLLSVPVKNDIYTEKMPSNMTFAAAAAEFGMVLRGSEYKGTASCNQILDLLSSYDYGSDEYKREFINLVTTVQPLGY